jgi:diacylglycerol kinase
MKSNKLFSISARLKSFVHAFEGILDFIKYEPQAVIHAIATVLVVAAGFYFSINTTEWIAVIVAIGLVIISEMMNTAIEKLTDMVSPEYNPRAKVVKDLAAGAVLIAALAAAMIGIVVFLPKL